VLREIVLHHIEEEENELFKTAREVLSRAEAEAIAEEVEARKAELDP
jgi:hemerythrin-like domain-containing protein